MLNKHACSPSVSASRGKSRKSCSKANAKKCFQDIIRESWENWNRAWHGTYMPEYKLQTTEFYAINEFLPYHACSSVQTLREFSIPEKSNLDVSLSGVIASITGWNFFYNWLVIVNGNGGEKSAGDLTVRGLCFFPYKVSVRGYGCSCANKNKCFCGELKFQSTTMISGITQGA